jgi:hypothetical protein
MSNTAMLTNSILNAIMMKKVELLRYGPEAVMNAAEEAAEFAANWEEIGTSDMTALVNRVEVTLKGA